MKNRFNRLTSKEWLPFQKSWFKYKDDYHLYREHVRFFCKAESNGTQIFYSGSQLPLLQTIAAEENLIVTPTDQPAASYEYVLIDIRDEVTNCKTGTSCVAAISEMVTQVSALIARLEDRRFVTIFLPQGTLPDQPFVPVAWMVAYALSQVIHLKDEKIACLEGHHIWPDANVNKDVFYCLNFRKDDKTDIRAATIDYNDFLKFRPFPSLIYNKNQLEKWFVLKPAPRKKNEILHPAKYPEDLVDMYVNAFTQPNENVFDPMSGTGSTQVAALKSGRNAYGTELSPYFHNIAVERCADLKSPAQLMLFHQNVKIGDFDIKNIDARQIDPKDFPPIHYIITSPPYWDMLNMKGAENQAKRIEKGLQTNYSDDDFDLGNIPDYHTFIDDLAAIYIHLKNVLVDQGMMTIVVKNIKKKGRNYPFAWDLTHALLEDYVLVDETFWCQDDINLAPYGYGNTFVSNTFHQYCLHFQKR